MKTTISKKSILFLSITAFVLSLTFSSCSDSEEAITTADETVQIIEEVATEAEDAVLITSIENSAKTTVAAANLPEPAKTVLATEFADSYVQKAQLATDLGYVVTITTDNESRTEETSDVLFSKKGRKLKDNREKAKKRRNKCFQFVFPVDFIMPDASTITLNSKEDWTLIREWYKANTEVKERPELVFPVNVTLEDDTTQTLIDREELKAIKDSCKQGKDKRKCFKLVLPVSFTTPDSTVITVNERADFKLVRAYRKANPRSKKRAQLNFPVDIMYTDDTTATIANAQQLQRAKQSCKRNK